MAKREFLMLAHPYKENKHNYAGWYASEKLDGMRAYWDGGISLGIPAKEVPWANTEKHDRFVDPNVIATGLWSRYGQVIRAPDYWLDLLPPLPLDGELILGRGRFQELVSVVKHHSSLGWSQAKVKYAIFDSPTYNQIFATGMIDSPPNFVKYFVGCDTWAMERADRLKLEHHCASPLGITYPWLNHQHHFFPDGGPAYILDQTKLSDNFEEAKNQLETMFLDVTVGGGEGLIVRNPNSFWKPERTHSMLKVKPFDDMEVTVIGFTFGKETDRGSKHLGKIGSLRVKDEAGKVFDISGLNDQERELISGSYTQQELESYGAVNAGTACLIDHIVPQHFPIGSKITIKYRELSRDGIPKEARYFRKAT